LQYAIRESLQRYQGLEPLTGVNEYRICKGLEQRTRQRAIRNNDAVIVQSQITQTDDAFEGHSLIRGGHESGSTVGHAVKYTNSRYGPEDCDIADYQCPRRAAPPRRIFELRMT